MLESIACGNDLILTSTELLSQEDEEICVELQDDYEDLVKEVKIKKRRFLSIKS